MSSEEAVLDFFAFLIAEWVALQAEANRGDSERKALEHEVRLLQVATVRAAVKGQNSELEAINEKLGLVSEQLRKNSDVMRRLLKGMEKLTEIVKRAADLAEEAENGSA